MTDAYVLLDRDGVINYDSDDYIKSEKEWTPIPKSLEAIALFTQNNYKVIVITNQSGIRRGLYDDVALMEIHNKMHRLTRLKGGQIENIYICPHIPEDDCHCRKPKPGLLNDFAKDKNISLNNIYFIGDKLADIQAAEAAGAKAILVKTGKGQKTLDNNSNISHPIFDDLYDAAKFIIK
ncbi:MAG: D-glycero-beta-D-manno-heptose 1,7-bisphosphate 7-phosphatase [Methylococcales symbiont of Iophon sp. n. MRB-2018]|nr:MAG: D-glycero-beta-D-manno-heptose 1,7-bisphosphate 7-phosphatase [Methylococcales symbiont of Iophon sp. n. MRB-2018]KAF3980397.1 MAG: D-glycero-beta-D-manno-heptose 1,7-bisphosphate 7-phosphatase [Methylococcales symbiont of Iophon sp. n. MRB-2018]